MQTPYFSVEWGASPSPRTPATPNETSSQVLNRLSHLIKDVQSKGKGSQLKKWFSDYSQEKDGRLSLSMWCKVLQAERAAMITVRC